MIENPQFGRFKPQHESQPPLIAAAAGRLETILKRSCDVDSFDAQCSLNGLYPKRASMLLEDPEISLPLIDIFLENPDRYRYQLAMAGSKTPFDVLTEEQKERLGIIRSDTSLDVGIFHPSWDLCFRSEDYMMQALNKDESLLVINDGLMLAKSKGYKTILALKTFADNRGMVVAGNWYSPEGEAKTLIKEAFLNNAHDAYIPSGQLVLMRSLSDGRTAQRVFERAGAYVEGGDFGQSRREAILNQLRKGF